MKTKSLILAGLALVAAAACNKTPEETPTIDGGQAYLAVEIAYANGSTTRAAGTTDEGYAYGETNETFVSGAADFFFYMGNGTYFTHSSQTISATTGTNANIEKIGNGVVVLKGLTSTTTPTYMAVVLNGSSTLIDNLKGKNLSEAKAYVTDEYATYDATATTPWSTFTMTSSSYKDATENAGYYCSKLSADMFKTTQADAEAAAAKAGTDVAVAYVERLAVKATLSAASTLTTKTIGSETVYELDSSAPAIEVYDGTTGFTTPTYYVKFNNWGLNSKTQESYTYKHIDPTAFSNTFGSVWTWDMSADFRSYWAESVNYGLTSTSTPAAYYPVSRGNNTPVWDDTKNTLDYISYAECAAKLGGNDYCRENTNTEAVLKANNFSSTATSALLTAQIVDANGNPVNLVIYNYKYFTEEGYYNYVLYNNSADVPYVSDGNGNYVKADKSYLEVVNDYDAYVHVQFKATDGTNAITYYADATGTTTKDVTDINATWNRNLTQAEFYKDGMMYYNIPIEHLRKTGTFSKGDYTEADYGVVRNHWYKLEVTKIANLGHPVYDKDEKIVPNDEDTKKYYVAAKINILAWKVVKQSVEL